MKKFLLTIAVVSALFGTAIAQEKLIYAPANEPISNVGISEGGVVYSAAVKISGESAKALKGSKLTMVSISMGSMTNKTAELFITHDLKGEYDYTQTYRGSVNKYRDVELDTPYECDGEDFYIGYNYKCTSYRDSPISIDDNYVNPFPDWFYLTVYKDEAQTPIKKMIARENEATPDEDGGEPATGEGEGEVEGEEQDPNYPYENLSEMFGNLCIRATFEGENLPKAIVYPCSMVEPSYAEPGKPFGFPMTVSNMGAAAISNLEVTYNNIKGEPETKEVTLETPIEVGTFGEINVSDIVFEEEAESINLNVAITKVNGVENVLSDLSIATDFESVTDPFLRALVVEENTGVDCGYCPIGYAGMEYMHNNYPDVILLAAHNYGYPADPMNCQSYIAWGNTYTKGAPQATVNRIKLGEPDKYSTGYTCSASKGELIEYYNLIANRPCVAKMAVEGNYSEGNDNEVKMTVKSTFKKSFDSHNYALAFAVTENGVGPYRQQNYYAGGRYGECEGFENEKSQVSLIYNDVARHIWNWNGLKGTIPAKIVAGEEVEYDFLMDVSNVTDHRNATIIALLIDQETGEIVTGAKNVINNAKEPEEPNVPDDAVEEVRSAYNVTSANGVLTVNGDFDNAIVYSMDGVKVAALTESGNINLPAGIYAVSVESEGELNVVKVIIK